MYNPSFKPEDYTTYEKIFKNIDKRSNRNFEFTRL